ncbi:universal stress protein [Streptomyces sp. NPDC020807]|uniref:universal stress protein n=1 Tax=Streptomyces sp. NPDC020807 TaxID=3155119 RepID=UPI0033F3FDD1
MAAQVTVGLDGSEESLAAARWATGEAVLRGVPLRLVHVEEWPNTPEIPAPYARTLYERAEALLHDEADRARKEHPDLEVTTERARGRAADELVAASDEADLLVLGSRGLGGVLGFVVGSVSLAVVGVARRPVVLVRARRPDPAASAHGIVVGVDLHHPCEPLLAFAFGEAARRRVPLRFLSTWTVPASYGYAAVVDPGIAEELGAGVRVGLDELRRRWRSSRWDERAVEGRTGRSAPRPLLASRSGRAGHEDPASRDATRHEPHGGVPAVPGPGTHGHGPAHAHDLGRVGERVHRADEQNAPAQIRPLTGTLSSLTASAVWPRWPANGVSPLIGATSTRPDSAMSYPAKGADVSMIRHQMSPRSGPSPTRS